MYEKEPFIVDYPLYNIWHYLKFYPTLPAMKLSEQEIIELNKRLSQPQEICIITHRNPDGDALGSSLGLKLFLEKFHHNVSVILPSEYPSTFHFMQDIDQCVVFDLKRERTVELIGRAEMIFCLDFNALDRIDKIAPYIEESNAKKVLIDHHLDPEPFVDYTFSEIEASSTSELIYKFVDDLGHTAKLDREIGEALFVGIITDTGSFKYNTRAETYAISAKLKALGVDDYDIQDKIFNNQKEKQLRLLGHCLANRMEIIPEYRAGIIALTKKDFIEFDIQRGDTEGIVNFMLMIEGIEVAAFIREQPQIVKLSLRSKGDISVQEMARNHFNGGGHKNASGGAAYAKLEDIVNRFKNILPKYVEKRNI